MKTIKINIAYFKNKVIEAEEDINKTSKLIIKLSEDVKYIEDISYLRELHSRFLMEYYYYRYKRDRYEIQLQDYKQQDKQ